MYSNHTNPDHTNPTIYTCNQTTQIRQLTHLIRRHIHLIRPRQEEPRWIWNWRHALVQGNLCNPLCALRGCCSGCSVLQCIAVCCSVLQLGVGDLCNPLGALWECCSGCSMVLCVAVCCSVVQQTSPLTSSSPRMLVWWVRVCMCVCVCLRSCALQMLFRLSDLCVCCACLFMHVFAFVCSEDDVKVFLCVCVFAFVRSWDAVGVCVCVRMYACVCVRALRGWCPYIPTHFLWENIYFCLTLYFIITWYHTLMHTHAVC